MPRALGSEVFDDILEHRCALRIDVVSFEERIVGGLGGLCRQTRRDDIKRILEEAVAPELKEREDRVVAGSNGEDQLAAWPLREFVGENRIRVQRRTVDVVD